jgi:hypothetical protein
MATVVQPRRRTSSPLANNRLGFPVMSSSILRRPKGDYRQFAPQSEADQAGPHFGAKRSSTCAGLLAGRCITAL